MVLRDMSNENRKFRELQNQQFGVERRSVTFCGSLPPPEILKQYNEVSPGAADRIITMAEEQSSHRRTLESKVINSDITNSKLGLFFGLVIGLAGMVAAVIGGIYVGPVMGSILGVGTLSSLVGIFVYGSQSRRKERGERREETKE